MPPKVYLDDGQVVHASKTQKWLWSCWLDYWERTAEFKKELGAPVIGVINGDWGDVNTHSGFQLIEPMNPDVVLDMMVATVQPMLPVCDKRVIVRGTEAHTGGVGWLENRAAKEIGAIRNRNEKCDKNKKGTWSWYVWEADVAGVGIVSAHHPGTNSGRPWTKGNDANRRAAWDVYNYAMRDWAPQLTLWGHYHHDSDSQDTHSIRAIYNRSWQVKTAFTHRIGRATDASEIGGLWVFCEDGEYEVKKCEYELPRPKIWKIG
jgi:hypothetical protein